MKRRTYIHTVLAGAALLAPAAEVAGKPIELHVDLTVDPAKEAEMLKNFHTVFRPAASKQPGYIDMQILKLRSTLNGQAPAGANYRFVLTFESEQLRQAWITSATHQKVWPTIERTLANKNYNVLLFDSA